MSLRIATLGLLAQHPGSGYELLRRFEKSMANVWPATQSQLYSELNRLAEDGFIEVGDVGPRGRKVYRITASGRAELERWIVHPQDDPPFRSPALLRVFLLGQIPQAEARAHLHNTAERAEAEVARLSALRDSIADGTSVAADHDTFFRSAALDYGLRFNAMQADWARTVIARLDRREKPIRK